MATIQENLTLLKSTKAGIKSAIEAKGVSDVGDTFSAYPAKIASIPTGTTINNQDKTITANGSYSASSGYTGLGTVTVNVEAKLPYVSNISFGHTTFTGTEDLANFNLWLGEVLPQIEVPGSKMFMDFVIPEDSTTRTLDVTSLLWTGLESGTFDCSGMFAQNNVYSVKLPESQNVSPNVTWNFQRAFYMYSGSNIENLGNGFVNYKPTSTYYMFGFAGNLNFIDLSNWDLSECSNFTFMFSHCTNTSELLVSSNFFNSTISQNYDFTGLDNVSQIAISYEYVQLSDSDAWDTLIDKGMFAGTHSNQTLIVPQSWLTAMQNSSRFSELSSRWNSIVASS